jgi:hypothetical protein
MQNLLRRSLQLPLLPAILDPPEERMERGGMSTKSPVHVLDGAVLFGDLIAAEFLLG